VLGSFATVAGPCTVLIESQAAMLGDAGLIVVGMTTRAVRLVSRR
jgi:hypothetical protein